MRFYIWLWANHLAFGYFSVPPSIAVFAKMIITIFGDSVFAVRLVPALIGVASVIVIGLIVREFGGRGWAILLACAAFIVSPAFLRSNTLFQPVSFNQFYWLLTSYFVVKLLKSMNPKYWLHLGMVGGLAFLNKYSIAFLVAAFLIALLLTPERKLFLTKYFPLGLLIGCVIILPNLIWQHTHNWPVIAHMQRLQATQLVHVNLLDFLILQLLMNLPVIFVWLFGLIFLLFFKEVRKYRALAFTYLILIFMLMILRGKPYYTLGVYSVLFAAGGFAIEKYTSESRRFFKPLTLVLMILIAIPVVPYSLPVLPFDKMVAYGEASKKFGLSGALRWEDGRLHSLPQDYADMTGWQELSEIVIRAYSSLSEEEKKQCVIYAQNYGQAGAIKHYGKARGLPEPVSFHGSFLFWAPDSVNLTTFIYVNDELGDDIQFYFADIQQVGQITNVYARETGLPVYLCKNPKPEFREYYREKVARLKNAYR